MVGTLPSGCCLQGVRAEPQSPNETGHDMRVLGGMGKSIERKKNHGRSEPEPASAHRLSMSFPLAIPWRVALQQSLPPLRQPPSIVPQPDSNRPEPRAPHTSSPPHTGLDAEKTSRSPAREECFYLTSPLIEPAVQEKCDEKARGPIFLFDYRCYLG
jgi:hypothetical protein